MIKHENIWLEVVLESLAGYRKMIDKAVMQLTDDQLRQRLTPQSNSVAVLLRHLGGNLLSRWTDFLKTDGEKPNRNRDSEFEDWSGDRASLLQFFDSGWQAIISELESFTADDLAKSVEIRGVTHTVPDAIVRSITHLSYHVGQLVMIARLVHDADGNEAEWKWLTIPPGASKEFNQKTWGISASRDGVAAIK